MINRLFDDIAAANSDRIALVQGDRRVSYFELQVYLEWTSRYFHSLAVRPGHRIALLMPNGHEFVISFLGLLRLGGVAVPVDVFEEVGEIRPALQTAQVHAILTTPAYRDLAAELQLPRAGDTWPLHKMPVAVLDEDNIETSGNQLPAPGGSEPRLDLDNRNGSPGGRPADNDETGRNRPFVSHPAVLFPPSRQARQSNWVRYTHQEVVQETESFLQAASLTASDCILCVLPFAYPCGLINGLVATIAAGARMILLEQFDRGSVLQAFREEEVTVYPGLPGMFGKLLDHASPVDNGGHALRLCLSAGGALTPEVNERFRRQFGVSVKQL